MLRHVLRSTTALCRDRRGVTQIEYAILAALLGVSTLGAVVLMRDGTRASLDATTVAIGEATARPAQPGGPSISWANPDLGKLVPGRPFSLAPTAQRGEGFVFEATDLPDWMTLDPQSGALTGTTAPGAFVTTVRVLAPNGLSASAELRGEVLPFGTLDYPQWPTRIEQGTSLGPIEPETNLLEGRVWSSSGTLPAGLVFNSGTGVLSGTPTALQTFAFTVDLASADGREAQRSFSGEVVARPPIAGTGFGWGANTYGTLGVGTGVGSLFQSPTAMAATTNVSAWRQLSVGNGGFACGIANTGGLYCWGNDNEGQLGNGAATGNKAAPVPVTTSITDWKQVSAGHQSACALTSAGDMYCWGTNYSGRFPFTPEGLHPSPVLIAPPSGVTGWEKVVTGPTNTCAMTQGGGDIYCVGPRNSALIGDGQPAVSVTEKQWARVVTPPGVVWADLAVTSDKACALTRTEVLYCWGPNGDGRLQTENKALMVTSPSPVVRPQGVTGWRGFSVASNMACGIATDDRLFCWGSGALLGTGLVQATPFPPQLVSSPTGAGWRQVVHGGNSFDSSSFSCGITTDGAVSCWGADGNGQQGNGSGFTAQTTPRPVVPPGSNTRWLHLTAFPGGGASILGLAE